MLIDNKHCVSLGDVIFWLDVIFKGYTVFLLCGVQKSLQEEG